MRRRYSAAIALIIAGSLLAGCGGGSDDPPAASAGTTTASSTAPTGPTLAASQELVDLANRYAAELPSTDEIDFDDVLGVEQDARRFRDAAATIQARIDGSEAHACVETLVGEQAGLMRNVANLLQARADGRLTDAIAIAGEVEEFDRVAFERAQDACKAQVGYRGLDDQ